jgi:prepilin-type N-terminal cleavage/methylation domain-containing protein
MIMRKKGFTLVELLIVIAIIALLMGILMPALARVRMYAYRMTCGTNLAGIGKAALLYASDARGEAYPMPGCTNLASYAWDGTTARGYLQRWWGGDPADTGAGTASYVYRNSLNGTAPAGAGHGTIGSLFYLLVKYQDVAVKQFICKGDVGVKIFKLTDSASADITEFTKAWDFGADPGKYCSYSYHNPFSPDQDNAAANTRTGFAVGGSSPPAMPLAADRNPSLDKNVTYIQRYNLTQGGLGTDPGKQTPREYWDSECGVGEPKCTYNDPDLMWNSFAHQREGQNVLYNDGHVSFERTANVGIDNDNIWQSWPASPLTALTAKYDREVYGYFAASGSATQSYSAPVWNRSTGTTAVAGSWFPAAAEDSLLISDQQDTPAHSW